MAATNRKDNTDWVSEMRSMAMERLKDAEPVLPDFPNPDNVTTEAAFKELTLAIYGEGYKMGMGLMSDGSGIYLRISCPLSSEGSHAGKVAFTVSDTLEKGLKKLVQLLETNNPKIWKDDQYAKA